MKHCPYAILFLLAFAWTAASAADFSGTYKGKQTVTSASGRTQYCGTGRDVTLIAKGNTLSLSGRNVSGKIGPDGSFTLTGSINNDGDIMTIKGMITGNSLKGMWNVPGKAATCGGEYIADKVAQ